MTVYAIQEERGDALKIGYTSGDPRHRVASLQTATSRKLTVVGAMVGSVEDERRLHDQIATHRIRGEWFADVPAVRDAFREAQSRAQIEEWKARIRDGIATLAAALDLLEQQDVIGAAEVLVPGAQAFDAPYIHQPIPAAPELKEGQQQ